VGEDVRRETRKVSVSKNTAVLWGTMKHRLAVVGAGMIGSSAARWASVTSASSSEGGNVVLVGPGEEIWGAWADHGRTTRVLEPSKSWRILAEKSVSRFRFLS